MAVEAPFDHPPEWRLVRLGDITCKIGSGSTPRGGGTSYLPARARAALVRSQNVFDRYFDSEGLAFISDDQARLLEGVSLRPRDILLNITGDGVTFARSCIIPDGVLPAYVNQHVAIIRLDSRFADSGYVLAYLTLPVVKEYIESFNAGGSRRAITKGHIQSFRLPLPPLPDQRAIASILGALDDKIELNRKMSATLEAMARAIFKSWFVDFDPVRAKAEGRRPEGMDEATAALFPDRCGEDGLPDGWRREPLLELCELKRGYDLPLAQRRSGPIPIYSSSGATGCHDEAQASSPGIVTGRYGTIGQVFFVETPYWPLNTTLYVRDFKGHEPRYVYYVLRDLPYGKYVDKAAVPGVNRNDLHREPIVLPSRQVERAFASTLVPFWKRQALNARQVATLESIRDLLLPRLVSGQLRVPDAEKTIEAVFA